jgi:hypothetical protein
VQRISKEVRILIILELDFLNFPKRIAH